MGYYEEISIFEILAFLKVASEQKNRHAVFSHYEEHSFVFDTLERKGLVVVRRDKDLPITLHITLGGMELYDQLFEIYRKYPKDA